MFSRIRPLAFSSFSALAIGCSTADGGSDSEPNQPMLGGTGGTPEAGFVGTGAEPAVEVDKEPFRETSMGGQALGGAAAMGGSAEMSGSGGTEEPLLRPPEVQRCASGEGLGVDYPIFGAEHFPVDDSIDLQGPKLSASCSVGDEASYVFGFVAPEAGEYTFNTGASQFDTVLVRLRTPVAERNSIAVMILGRSLRSLLPFLRLNSAADSSQCLQLVRIRA